MTSLLIFRAGSSQPKAVPLSLVTRLEELDTKKVEMSNGRPLIQYRGQLMPLIRVNDDVKVKTEGTQPLLVFSDEGRSMGLVVDQIVDIVEDRLNIEVPSEIPGVLGSAVVKGQATEILDVGYYLPQAFEDWLIRTEKKMKAQARTILFVEDSAFFRNMLTPVLRSAGYSVTTVPDAHDALAVLKSGDQVDMIVTDIEMPGMSGFELAQAVRSDERTAKLPIIALSALTSPDAIERGRQVGFHDYVAKFDRPGLIAALKEQAALMGDTQQAA
jgi:two-component system, chemotaxis family, sensor kinase CheA